MKNKILIIDDEIGKKESSIQAICSRLINEGYEIIPCKSFDYSKKIKALIENNYRDLRLIVCDLVDQKTGTSKGWEVIDSIKSDKNKIEGNEWYTMYLPIVVVTQAQEKDYTGGRDIFRKEHVALFGKNVSEVFYGCINVLVNMFDTICQEKMRHKVAVSYTWYDKQTNDNHQPFVEHIAHSLFEKYKKENVFYDNTKISETAGSYIDDLPERVYKKGCDLVLVFLSNNYAISGWTEKEWEQTKLREDKKFLFVAIDDLDKFAVAKNLFPDEWKNEITNDQDEEKKKAFFNKYIPLYFDCHENKEIFESSRKVNKVEEHNKAIKSTEPIIEEIIRNIDKRIKD